jgi:protein O-GlcNAc transferase
MPQGNRINHRCIAPSPAFAHLHGMSPTGPPLAFNAVVALHRAGKIPEAIAGYQTLLAHHPRDLKILTNLATAYVQAGRPAEARDCYQRAVAVDEAVPELWFNFANFLASAAGPSEAEPAYRRAVALHPQFHPAWTNLGNLLARLGRIAEAVEAHREAVRLAPQDVIGLRSFARLCGEAAQMPDEAARLYRAALALDPRHANSWNALGVVLQSLGQLGKAVECWEKALTLAPQHAGAHNNLGTALRLLKRPDEGIEHLRLAAQFDPHDPVAAANLTQALLAVGQGTEACRLAEQIVAQHPQNANAHLTLGLALTQSARIEESRSAFLEAHRLDQNPAALSNALFASLYSDRRSAMQHLEEHRRLGEMIAASGPVRTHWDRDRRPARALRVGYLSADLRTHPVTDFLKPILQHHDPARVEVFAHSTDAVPDATTAELRACAVTWRDCAHWDDTRLAAQIEADRLDILVDLAGHTAGNRAQLLRRRLAPIQVLYIGYPCTAGLADYLIADAQVCPPGHERFYTEQVVRVPGSFWCYAPRAHAPEPGPLPAKTRGSITFGSFHTLAKISLTTIALWARVLAAVPDSRLVLKALALADAATRETLRARFVAAGVDPARLVIEPPTLDHAAFLRAYHQIDIALDSIPYNGGTTTCEALWMGVPVVTLAGDHFFSRMSGSFLHHVGLDDLVADSQDEYLRIAASLAADIPRLEALRNSLRSRMSASPLCDGPRAARELETAYRMMWHAWLATRSP